MLANNNNRRSTGKVKESVVAFQRIPRTITYKQEFMFLVRLPCKEFMEWHRKDALLILNHIEKFKNPKTSYTFTHLSQHTKRHDSIDEQTNREELEGHLEEYYSCVIAYYSMQYSCLMLTFSNRKNLLAISQNLKNKVEKITYEISLKSINIEMANLSCKSNNSKYKKKVKFDNSLRYWLNYDKPPEFYKSIARNTSLEDF